MSSRRYTRGFSLVELMVAMVLGLLLTAAAVSLFSTNQRTFQLQQTMGQLQEQGQLAMRFINQDVRRLGLVKDDVAAIATTPPGGITSGSLPPAASHRRPGQRSCMSTAAGTCSMRATSTSYAGRALWAIF